MKVLKQIFNKIDYLFNFQYCKKMNKRALLNLHNIMLKTTNHFQNFQNTNIKFNTHLTANSSKKEIKKNINYLTNYIKHPQYSYLTKPPDKFKNN